MSNIENPSIGQVLKQDEDTRTIQMADGSQRIFSLKRKLQKESTYAEGGIVTTKFFFDNGKIYTFSIDPSHPLYSRFVAHGIEAKFGDAANTKDPLTKMMADTAKAYEIIEALAEQINAGNWNSGRTTSSGERKDALAEDIFQALINIYQYNAPDLEASIAKQVTAGTTKSRNAFLTAVGALADVEAEVRRIRAARISSPDEALSLLASLAS